MLYVYSFFDYTDEFEELGIVLDDIKEFKPFGEWFRRISDRNDIIIDGKEPFVTPLQDLIGDYFDGGDTMELKSCLLDEGISVYKMRAIELLCDDLRVVGSYGYTQRIWESDDAYEEIEKIIKELAAVVVGMIIDELNDEYERIKEGKFEWV